jgi:hypothetical protein
VQSPFQYFDPTSLVYEGAFGRGQTIEGLGNPELDGFSFLGLDKESAYWPGDAARKSNHRVL